MTKSMLGNKFSWQPFSQDGMPGLDQASSPSRGFASAGKFQERSLAQLPNKVLILCCFRIGCIAIYKILYTSRGMAYLTFSDV
jgi:hypothetical protein